MTAARSSPYLTLTEAADYLRIDEKTLRRHVMREIPPLSIGRRKFYTQEMLDAWHDRTRRVGAARGRRRGGLVSRPRCTVLHPQGSLSTQEPCGRPARWRLRAALVCARCRLLMGHLPADLFREVGP